MRLALVFLLWAALPARAVERAIPGIALPPAVLSAGPSAQAFALPALPSAAVSPALAVAPPPLMPSLAAPLAPQAAARLQPQAAQTDKPGAVPMAALSDALANLPPLSSSAEDAESQVRALAGLMTGESARAPPAPQDPDGRWPDSGVVRVPDVPRALAALRAASHPRHQDTDALLAALSKNHPELPLTPDRVFLVKDAAALEPYGVPSAAAGAARILSEGRDEAKIVILVAPRGVALDDFVEYSIHEAVHLADDGILRISHERFVEHWFAEGYTQLRAHEMANASLLALGRRARPNAAYSREVELVRAFIARHGEAPLKELVERGSPAGLARALGSRWHGLLALAAQDERSTQRQRDWFLRLAETVVEHPEFGAADFEQAARSLHGRPS